MKLSLASIAGFVSLLAASVQASTQDDFLAEANAAPNGIITLDSASYERLISSSPKQPRNYSVAVVLTALPPQFKCQPCHTFDPTYKTVADSWKRASKAERKDHFFAQLDFTDGQAVFQKLGLQSAPNLQYFPPKAGPRKSEVKQDFITYDFSRNGFGVEKLHKFMSDQTPHPFPIYVPFNPIPYILIPTTLIGGIVGLYYASPYIIPLAQSKALWQGACLVAILIFTSGHMWNRIRGAQYSGPNGEFVQGGFQQQYVIESQMIGGIYGLLAFSAVALSTLAPKMLGSYRQRFAVYIWIGVMVFVFSYLVRIFKIKNGGYPFRLFLG